MEASALNLWRRWVEGRDGDAFARLVGPELPHALSLARRRGLGAADAEDVVQDCLVDLARERTERPVRVGIRPWLLRAVRSRAGMALRSGGRRRRRERRVAAADAGAPPPGREAELRDEVERLLSGLPETDREALLLRYLHDLEYDAVARVLGTSKGAARVRVHRALERLRERFGDGAAALVAALPLPSPARGPELVSAATAAAPAAAASALTGAIVMKIGTKTALLALLLLTGGFLLGRAAAARPEPASSAPSAGPAPARPTGADAGLRAETEALRARGAELEAEAAEADDEVAAAPAASAADGTVEFPGLESGSWWVAVAIPGGDRRLSVRTQVGWRAEVVLPVPSGAAGVEGTVRDREGPPRPGVSMTLAATRGNFHDRLRTKTDAAGRYRFEAVPAGEWTLTAAGAGIDWPRQPSAIVTVPAGGTVEQDLDVGVPSLSGEVRNAETGEPMPGVDVIVGLGSFYASNVTSDDRGEWTAFDVRPGEVRLIVRRDGFVAWQTGPFELEAGETKRLEIELEPAAVVEARFLDGNGEPVTKAVHLGFRRVGAESSLSLSLPGATNGRHEYAMLPAGDYEITGRVEGVGEATVRRALVAGRTNRVELRLVKR